MKGPSPPTWKLALVKWPGLFPPLLALSYGFNFLSRRFLSTDLWFVQPDGTMLLWVKLLGGTAVPQHRDEITEWLAFVGRSPKATERGRLQTEAPSFVWVDTGDRTGAPPGRSPFLSLPHPVGRSNL